MNAPDKLPSPATHGAAGRSTPHESARAQVADTIDGVLAQVGAAARPGDHVLCMSNGGFGGIHARLLQALDRPLNT